MEFHNINIPHWKLNCLIKELYNSYDKIIILIRISLSLSSHPQNLFFFYSNDSVSGWKQVSLKENTFIEFRLKLAK